MDTDDNTTMTTNCQYFYTEQQCTAMSIARTITSLLSVVGSVFLIFVICLFRKYRRLNYRILLYIAICSFFNGITILLAGVPRETKHNAWCIIRGMSLQFNAWGILLWQFALTFNMFLNTMIVGLNRTYNWIERVYQVFCWGISGVAALIPLIFNKYGPDITWCWIADHEWKIWAYYLEYVVVMFAIFGLYAKVVFTVLTLRPRWRERHTESVKYEIYKKRIRPMMFFPLAILAVSVVPIIKRAHTFIHPDESPPFALAVLHVISVPLWGVLFAVVYGFDPETREELSLSNIKTTLQDRLYGASIGEVTIHDQPAQTTSSSTTGTTRPSEAANRESNLSAISIAPSTVYPSVRKK